MKENVTAFLYDTDEEQKVFGKHWVGPDRYDHGVKTLIAIYESHMDEDGQTVNVYGTCYGSVFYHLELELGSRKIEIATSSSMNQLAATIAEAIANGMLVIDVTQVAKS